MRGDFGVDVHEPGVARPGLEEKFSATAAARLKVDEGPDLLRPDVLGDEPVGGGKHVLLGAVEQENEVVFEGDGGGGEGDLITRATHCRQ